MNKCVFYGQILDKTFQTEGPECNVCKIVLKLKIENRRSTKSKNKKIDYEILNFEAWGGAALTLESNTNLGDYILIVDSTARATSHDCENSPVGELVCFRINEFKIIKCGGH
tara:strand:- start:4031 stop:4366 length:336 start_codon:yes stop_codon:yes gene_type:complete